MTDLNVKLVLQAIDRISGPVRQASRAFGEMGRKVSGAARQASRSMAGVEAASRRMRNVGRAGLLRLTAPVAALGGLSIRTAANFEKSMNRVQALSSATGEELAALEKQARDLGAATQFSGSEAAEAMGNLAQAGFNVKEIMGAVPSVLQLAAAANIDLGESASIVANIMAGYGLKIEDLARVNDVLVKAFTSATTDLSGLGQAMKFAGPIAAGLGIKFEETAAALALLASAGLDATLGGTALRGALSRLVNPTTEAIKVFKRLKIRKADILDSEGNLRSLIDVLGALERSGATAGDMLEIFGDRAGPGMQALVEKGAGALAAFTKQLEDSAGTAARVAAVQMAGTIGQIEELAGAFEELNLAIAKSGLQAWFNSLTVKLTEFSRSLGTLNPEILKWGTILAGVAAAIPVLLIGLAGLGFALSAMTIGWAVLKTATLAAAAALSAVLAPALAAVAAAFIANPIAATALAMAAAATLVIQHWEPIGRFFRDLWADIEAIFTEGVGFVLEKIKPIADLLPDFGFGGPEDSRAGRPASPSGRVGRVPTLSDGATAGSTSRLVIELPNAPAGTRVRDLEGGRGLDVEVDLGFAMGMP